MDLSWFLVLIAIPSLIPLSSLAAPAANEKFEATSPVEASGERVKVSNLREKYWAKGEESEFRVVQNRLYSKEGRVELGAHYGMVSQDPFLKVTNAGGSLAYYFTEFIGFRALYQKYFASTSKAYKQLTDAQIFSGGSTTRTGVNTNMPKYFYGGEGSFSPLYGKLSLLGKIIIYYDFHLLGGVGRTNTESGTYLTPFAGVSQQIYLGQRLSLKADFRFMHFKENLFEKVNPGTLGQAAGSRSIWSNTFNLGLTLLL